MMTRKSEHVTFKNTQGSPATCRINRAKTHEERGEPILILEYMMLECLNHIRERKSSASLQGGVFVPDIHSQSRSHLMQRAVRKSCE